MSDELNGGATEYDTTDAPDVPRSKRKAFEPSEAAALLTERLRLVLPGDVVTYRELSQVAGRDVRKAARSALDTARKRSGGVWEAIPNRGIRRMTDVEVVKDRLPARVRHIASTAASGLAEIATVDREALPEGERAQHDGMLTALSGIRQATTPKAVERTIDWAKEVGAALEARDWLRRMQGKAQADARERLLRGKP
jgi:hypothetical protein